MLGKYRSIVLKQLVTIPETRSNDKLLIRNVVKEVYGTTDINDLLEVKGNLFESIRRTRQHVQSVNPSLRPDEPVAFMRQEKESAVREEVKGL